MIITRVYQYGDIFKVVYSKFSSYDKPIISVDFYAENEVKLDNSLSRSKGRITELALCNPWEFFVTLTLDGDKQDRFTLETYVRDLGVWVGNFNKKYSCKLKYVLIPERHKNGAWHMHGLFSNIPSNALEVNKNGYLCVPYYAKRFGYLSMSRIQNKVKVARYITKYVTKSINGRSDELGKHLFYSSRGLQGRSLSAEFHCDSMPENVAYQNDYCGIEWANNEDELDKLLARVVVVS